MSEEELQREILSGAFSMQVADCERNIRIQFENLQQENNQLKERINKAVDYINWWVEDNKKQEIGLTISETDGLLSLLKGDKE